MANRLIWTHAAHPELRLILQKLEARFGPALHVLPSEPEWLTFQVTGLTDAALLRNLELEDNQIFGQKLPHFQIICEQSGKERGVSIRYLPDAAAVSGARSGFWFY